MAHQFSYDNRGGTPWPENQFMDVLKDRKVGTLWGDFVLFLTCYCLRSASSSANLILQTLTRRMLWSRYTWSMFLVLMMPHLWHVLQRFLQDANGDPRIWRRVRLSAGMKIGVFQDKVLSPILNWYSFDVPILFTHWRHCFVCRVRNLHCYTFTDLRDGAVFGPEVNWAAFTS